MWRVIYLTLSDWQIYTRFEVWTFSCWRPVPLSINLQKRGRFTNAAQVCHSWFVGTAVKAHVLMFLDGNIWPLQGSLQQSSVHRSSLRGMFWNLERQMGAFSNIVRGMFCLTFFLSKYLFIKWLKTMTTNIETSFGSCWILFLLSYLIYLFIVFFCINIFPHLFG